MQMPCFNYGKDICPSVTLCDSIKMTHATITEFSLSALGKTSFRIQKFETGHVNQKRHMRWGKTNWRFSTNKSPYLRSRAMNINFFKIFKVNIISLFGVTWYRVGFLTTVKCDLE